MHPKSLPILILSISNCSLLPATEPVNVAMEAAELAKSQLAWGASMNSPGASAWLIQSGHEGNRFRFRLNTKGLPLDQTYTLVLLPAGQTVPREGLKGITLDSSGQAICAGKPGVCGRPEVPNDPVNFVFQPIPGEPFRVGLVGSGGAMAFAQTVPVPIEGNDRGCRVDAVLLLPHAVAILIRGAGFPPGSGITFRTSSANERLESKKQADSSGNLVSVILPFRQGVRSGTTAVQLESAQCAPRLEFPWGE